MQEPRLRFKGFDDAWKESTLKNLGTIKAGGDVQKSKLKDKGKYPVLANGLNNDGIIGYYDNYKIDSPSVTITGRGDIGAAKARNYKYTPVVRLLSFKTNLNIYFTENAINNINILNESTGVPQLTSVQLGKYRIMYTSLLEQNKIGQFFNHFDKLIELQTSKLDHLKRLKKGYLQKMFPSSGDDVPELRFKGFSNKWKNEKIGDMLDYEQPTKYLVNNNHYKTKGIPVLTANKSFLLGYTNENDVYNKGKCIIFDDFTENFKFVNFKFKVKSSAIKILTSKNNNIWQIATLIRTPS